MKTAQDILNGWFQEEIKLLIAKGATDEDIRDPAFAGVLAKNVIKQHDAEILANKEIGLLLWRDGLKNTTPANIRKIAAMARSKGDADLAYDMEELADRCERGEKIT
jgi:hypothetical protein